LAKKRRSQFDTQEVQWDDEELRQRIEQRRRQNAVKKRRRKIVSLFAFVIIFTLLATMCGKDIVRLKAENRALRKQQIALEEQRDALQKELKNANNQEYIREQAKKQLRLLNPGEILFTFEDEEDAAAGEDGKAVKDSKAGKDKEKPKKKSGSKNPNVRSLHHIDDDEDYNTLPPVETAEDEANPTEEKPQAAEGKYADGVTLKDDSYSRPEKKSKKNNKDEQ
jgi:cell division protein FtsB